MEDEGVVVLIRQDTERRKRARQPISVPFQWEEKPGMPRKDWKLIRPSRPPPPPPPKPVKFVVSVPFKWEEKPGTPLRSFVEDQSSPDEPEVNRGLPAPPAYSPIWEYDQRANYHEDDDDDDDDVDERDWIQELENLTSSIQTTDSSSSSFISSADSMLANRLMPISALSSAIPLEDSSPQSPSSISSSDDSTSSYATGSMSSPVGNTFLEQLFPLHAPTRKSIFSAGANATASCSGQKNLSPGKGVFSFTTEQVRKPIQIHGRGESDGTRRQLTLGELIMLSRRRSYMRKAVPVHNSSGFMGNPRNKEGFEEQNSMGCLGSVNQSISKLLGGKRLLALKLT